MVRILYNDGEIYLFTLEQLFQSYSGLPVPAEVLFRCVHICQKNLQTVRQVKRIVHRVSTPDVKRDSIESMSSQQNIVDYLVEQMSHAGAVRSRKMFGEYAVYCNNKVVALVCDDQLYVKPTDEGKHYLSEIIEAPPYPGAKDYFQISEDYWNDSDWLSGLIRITTAALPMPKRKISL